MEKAPLNQAGDELPLHSSSNNQNDNSSRRNNTKRNLRIIACIVILGLFANWGLSHHGFFNLTEHEKRPHDFHKDHQGAHGKSHHFKSGDCHHSKKPGHRGKHHAGPKQMPLAKKGLCPQASKLAPSQHGEVTSYLDEVFSGDEYVNKSVEYLSGLVQIPSETYDDLGEIGQDKRWDIFYAVEGYLKKTFPKVFEKFTLEHVNTHNLVLTWEGSKKSAKPILLTAHQDVVPVLAETIPQWKYGPFSGHFDGEYVWGRGSFDDKNSLTGLLEAVTLLIEGGFEPNRTIILAFGFDEEVSGRRGASTLSKHLHDVYGDDSIYLLLDEGAGLAEYFDKVFAMVGVGEKGYIDLGITVKTSGGHGSVPPDHTAIGIISDAITLLEDNAFTPALKPENPIFSLFQCFSEHGSNFPPKIAKLLDDIAAGDVDAEGIAGDILSKNRLTRYLISTSQAVDKIYGGDKVNALPEHVKSIVNIRIDVGSSLQETKDHYTHLFSRIAKKYDLEYFPFTDGSDESTNKFQLVLTVEDPPLEPAPKSPWTGSETYDILSGTVQYTLQDVYPEKPIFVGPAIMTGNTDTRYYWSLTENIYRFLPIKIDETMNHAHTVNERISIHDHIGGVKFYANFILNSDEAA